MQSLHCLDPHKKPIISELKNGSSPECAAGPLPQLLHVQVKALAGLLCRAAEEEMLAAQLNMEAAAADREVELLQTVEERFEELLPLMEAAGEARQEAESAAKQAQEVGFRIWGASLPCHSAAA